MDLRIDQLAMAVLFGSMGLVIFFTLVSRWLHVRSERRSLANRVICRLCLHAFEDTVHNEIVACPICGALSEKGCDRSVG